MDVEIKKDTEPEIEPEQGWRGRIPTVATIRSAVNNITVEPAIFLSSIASLMQSVVVQQLVKERSCRVSYNEPDEYCLNVTDAAFSRHLKVIIADYNFYTQLLVIGPYLFFALFLGSFVDRHGPKFMIMVPMLGELISCCILAIVSYNTWMGPEMTLVAHLFKGLTGSYYTFYMGGENYIMVNSSHTSRTARLALLDVAYSAGAPLGFMLGGLLYGTHNYTTVFLVSIVFFVLTITYLGVRLRKEPFLRTSPRRALSDAFSVADLRAGAMIACRPRPGRNRIYVIMSIICIRLTLFPMQGQYAVFYPYVQLKFNFTVKDTSYLDCFSSIIGCFGSLVVLPLLSYVFKVHDMVLGLSSVFLLSAANLFTALSNTYIGLYIAAVLQIGFSGSYIICRSMMSKCVDQDEQGKLNAFHGMLGAGAPIVAGLIYTELFHATVATYPAACFLLSAVLTLTPAAAFVWMLYDMRANKKLDTAVGDNVELIKPDEVNSEAKQDRSDPYVNTGNTCIQ